MSTALKVPWHHMTVAEFLDWDSGDGSGATWQLRDGEPEMVAPASDPHGSILARLAYQLIAHLDARDDPCRVVIEPGVVPTTRSEENCLVTDLGITCAPQTGARVMHAPLVLIEILSPTNVSKTRANVRAYRSIPTAQEIVVVHSTRVAAEAQHRGPDGSWPEQPELLGADETLTLQAIGFAAPLREAYRTSGLL